MNRREFSYVAALSGALLPQGRAERARSSPSNLPNAAGLISEMVFLDDCVSIAMYDADLSPASKTALTAYPDFVRNGALWPASPNAKNAEQFALSAGHVCSEALAKHRRPDSPEARLYHDIAVMRDMARKAYCDPSKPAPVHDLLEIIHVRRRLGLHTYNPDPDIQVWLEGIISWWKDQSNLLTALAAIYSDPDPSKVDEYVSGFYNPDDAIIRLARGFQFSEVPPEETLRPALDRASGGSHYARALKEAVEGFRSLASPA